MRSRTNALRYAAAFATVTLLWLAILALGGFAELVWGVMG